MLTFVLLLTALMLPLSAIMLVRNPFNIAPIVAALTWLFGVLPGVYFIITKIIPSYSWRNYTYVGSPLWDRQEVMQAMFELSLIGACFTVSFLFASLAVKSPDPAPAELRANNSLTTYAMIFLWLLSAVYFCKLANWNLKTFLLPVAEDYKESGYLLTIYIFMPLAIFVKSYWGKGRIDRWGLFWILMAVLAAFSRHQRRDLVTMVLFLVAFLPLTSGLLRGANGKAESGRLNWLWSKFGVFALLGVAMSLIPLLWYSRVFFTAAANGRILDPTQIRSFSDLLLGSPATGFPNLVLIREHVASFGMDCFHTIFYVISIAIPRMIWTNKPTDIDHILEVKYRLIENPSTFWFGELYFSYGIFAIPAAFILGFAIYYASENACRSKSLFIRSLAAVAFMQSVTLFKNGLAHFIINSLVFSVFLFLAWWSPETERRSGMAKSAI